jgi:D-amino-acid oxidase
MNKQPSFSLDRNCQNIGDGGSHRVLVIGAGVSGLTSALCLARKGFDVTVVAERFAPRVTSIVAGALWEWPPAVCGHHHDPISLARSKAWSAISYEIFADLAADRATGVYLRPAIFYFKREIAEDERQREKMAELQGRVREFRHDAGLIAANGINSGLGLRDAYSHLSPMVDTDRYLAWLESEVRCAGCRLIEGKFIGLLRDQEASLAQQHGASAIINCAGLGAGELAGDHMYPLRGALIRVRNDGAKMPRITDAHCVAHDGTNGDDGFIFVVPRGDDMLVLGGLAEPDEWSIDIGLHNNEQVRAMYQRCLEFMPVLKRAEIDATEPVRAGLRPVRPKNVRLEHEAGTCVIHNYGHGGSGVTFSWGCALEVVAKVEALLNQKNTTVASVHHSTNGSPSAS